MLPLPALRDTLRRGKTAAYDDIKNGLLTEPVRFGRSVAWPETEIAAIQRARLAGKSDDAIRALVADLHAARTAEEL
jgi:prophage regulatory protein